MWLPADRIPLVLTQFQDEVLLPRAGSNSQSFMTAMVIGLAGQRLMDAARSGAAATIGIADANGRINVDLLHEQAKLAISKSGGKVDVPGLGYRADAEDIDRLYQIASSQSEE